MTFPEGACVGMLKERIAQVFSVPADEAVIMAKGKKISGDDALKLDGIEKVMLMRKPVTAARNKSLSVTLRCINTGRLVRNVDVDARTTTCDDLSKLAVKA